MPNSQNFDVVREVRMSPGSPIRTAVILAAGMGIRLKERGRLMPKGCLRLGEESILEESILRLLGVGIQRIVIVTGHLADQFVPLRARYGERVEFVYNPHFGDSGSMYSLYCARHCVDESFLLLDADIVYECRALTSCLEHPSDNVVLLAGLSNTSDECFVETRSGNLLAISKNRESLGAEVRGEMVGICKISPSLFSLMLDMAEQSFSTTRHLDYEVGWLVSAAADVPISCPVIEDLVWCEIDDETHLARARNEIYPVVQERDMERVGRQRAIPE